MAEYLSWISFILSVAAAAVVVAAAAATTREPQQPLLGLEDMGFEKELVEVGEFVVIDVNEELGEFVKADEDEDEMFETN